MTEKYLVYTEDSGAQFRNAVPQLEKGQTLKGGDDGEFIGSDNYLPVSICEFGPNEPVIERQRGDTFFIVPATFNGATLFGCDASAIHGSQVVGETSKFNYKVIAEERASDAEPQIVSQTKPLEYSFGVNGFQMLTDVDDNPITVSQGQIVRLSITDVVIGTSPLKGFSVSLLFKLVA